MNDYQALSILIGLAIVGASVIISITLAIAAKAIEDYKRMKSKGAGRDAWHGEWH